MWDQIIVFETPEKSVAEARASLWNTRNLYKASVEFRAGMNPNTGRHTVWKVNRTHRKPPIVPLR